MSGRSRSLPLEYGSERLEDVHNGTDVVKDRLEDRTGRHGEVRPEGFDSTQSDKTTGGTTQLLGHFEILEELGRAHFVPPDVVGLRVGSVSRATH
jgi:hypothetical protein